MNRAGILGLLLFLLTIALPASAQQSTSFRLEEWVFNSGGHPQDGPLPGPASFLVTLGSIGDGLPGSALVSVSFRLGGGFVTSYPPPSEVKNVRFTGPVSLEWDMDPSAGIYSVYAGDVMTPWDAGYGMCSQSGLTSTAATMGTVPAPGQALFILVTAKNALLEEGTKGFGAGDLMRSNATPCQ